MATPSMLWFFQRSAQMAHLISSRSVVVLVICLFRVRLCYQSPVRNSDDIIAEGVMMSSDNLTLIISASDLHRLHRHRIMAAWLGAEHCLSSYLSDLKISIETVLTGGSYWFLIVLGMTLLKNQKVLTGHRPSLPYRFQTLWTSTKSAWQKLILC